MEGTWPLILDGVECGSVTAEKRGAYTLFTARALYTGEVKRISLYGGGAEGYLGVLSPDADGVSLTRKLTRSGMASFPERPEYAAEAGGGPERERAPERAEEQVQAWLLYTSIAGGPDLCVLELRELIGQVFGHPGVEAQLEIVVYRCAQGFGLGLVRALEEPELVYRSADVCGHDQALLIVAACELEHVLDVTRVHFGHAVSGNGAFNGGDHGVKTGIDRVLAAAGGQQSQAERE